MSTKPGSPTPANGTQPLSEAVKDSAQQIWQAGLGAFARAQEEGSKAFEVLVKEGVNIQRKTHAMAEEKLTDATAKMSDLASELSAKATGLSAKASGPWGKLETIFEDRVAKALAQLGTPSSKDLAMIHARLDEIQATLAQWTGSASATAMPRAKTTSTKPPGKKAASRSK